MTGQVCDAVLARMLAQRDLLQALDEQVKSISVRVTCPDRSVSVEVDAYGSMTGLWLAQFAYRNGAAALATLIVGTAQAAAKIAADRQHFLSRQLHDQMARLSAAPHSSNITMGAS